MVAYEPACSLLLPNGKGPKKARGHNAVSSNEPLLADPQLCAASDADGGWNGQAQGYHPRTTPGRVTNSQSRRRIDQVLDHRKLQRDKEVGRIKRNKRLDKGLLGAI